MNNKHKLAFGKKNYRIMLMGIAVLVAGFTIMTMDKAPYGFGVIGLTIGPIIVMTGFIIQFFAIFANSKEDK